MLEFQDVGKSFSGVRALRGVSFAVARGEIHALMGENGAGKSTLMKILSGVLQPDEGQVLLDGQPLRARGPREAAAKGIAIIHQELALVPDLSIAENIFLGREPRTAWGTLDRARMEREARALLDRLGLGLPPSRLVRHLRVGEQQLVEVAKALSLQARLLILDEPTSALSEGEIAHLFEVIRALKAGGTTMIYISHKLDEVFALCGQITVLRDGAHVATVRASETTEAELIQAMVGREVSEMFPREHATPGEEVLRVEGLSFTPAGGDLTAEGTSRRALRDISLCVRRGEVVGLAGLMGAGRTELLETLFGVHPPRRVSGRVRVGGRDVRFASPREAIRGGMAFVPEDRKGQGLLLGHSVGTNTTLAALRKYLAGGFVLAAREKLAVRSSMERLRVKASHAGVAVGTLSGGNQQKVVIARGLLTEPQVLLLDEPTRGIDVGAKAEIYALVARLAKEGAGVLVASSELPEILGMCDRVLVLCEGRLTGEFSRADATPEKILEAATRWQREREEAAR